jgi:hypothetical protein
VFECEKALLPISGGASIDLPDCLCLALSGPLFKLIEDEGKEKRHGEDRDKEIYDQTDIRSHTSSQTLYPGEQALSLPWWALTGVETAQILSGSRDVENAHPRFLLRLDGRISRTPKCSQPGAGTGARSIEEELTEGAGHYRARKGCPASDVPRL